MGCTSGLGLAGMNIDSDSSEGLMDGFRSMNRVWTVHLPLRCSLGEHGGIRTLQRIQRFAAHGIGTMPCLHPPHPKCRMTVEPPDPSLQGMRLGAAYLLGHIDPMYQSFILGHIV